MEKRMDVIKNNFFKLLRMGAFGEREHVAPMSVFKWRRLLQMAEAQDVVSIFAEGLNQCQDEELQSLPPALIEEIRQQLAKAAPQAPSKGEQPSLSNSLLNKRLEKIRYNERHSIDTSTETLHLLTVIVQNVNTMLNKGNVLRGIIAMGQYLRTRGDKVDFVKLEAWLSRLHLARMAQLQGSILMAVFGFVQEELPFVLKEEPKAYDMVLRMVSNTEKDTAEEWHFRQTRTGFVQNNSAVMRRNLRRSLRYIDYARIETTSNFIRNFSRSLSEIEE